VTAIAASSSRGVALSALVIGIGLIGDTLIYAVLPLYHEQFGIPLTMVGVLLSLNRWVRLLANSAAPSAAPPNLGLSSGFHRRRRLPADLGLLAARFGDVGDADPRHGARAVTALPGRSKRGPARRLDERPRFGARSVATATGIVLVSGYLLIAGHIDVAGSVIVVIGRGLFNTLIPVMVMERTTGGYLSSQASYSTWRDFGAALGPLSAPLLFLNVPQTPLFAALGLTLAGGVVFCLARR